MICHARWLWVVQSRVGYILASNKGCASDLVSGILFGNWQTRLPGLTLISPERGFCTIVVNQARAGRLLERVGKVALPMRRLPLHPLR